MIGGHCFKNLNNFILECVLESPMAHLFLYTSLRKAVWSLGPWHSKSSGLPFCASSQLLLSSASPNSFFRGQDLGMGRKGLGQTLTARLILGWGMVVAILAQGRECLARAWGLERGEEVLLPIYGPGVEYVPMWRLQTLGGHPLLSFGKAGGRPWEGEIHHAPSTSNSTVLQLWRGGALSVRITGRDQAPGRLWGCLPTPLTPESTSGSAILNSR